MRSVIRWIGMAGVLGATASTWAAWRIEEILFNPHGVDQGEEFIELRANPFESGNGVWVLAVAGTGSAVGVVTHAISLQGRTAGTNGLLLMRDSAMVLQPPPHSGTALMIDDFTPDLPNYVCTFIVATQFTGVIGQDLDWNDDGVLDTQPWTQVHSAIGIPYGISSFERTYGAGLGGVDFGFTLSLVRQAILTGPQNEPILTSIRFDNTPSGPYVLLTGSCYSASGAPYSPTPGQALTPGSRAASEVQIAPTAAAVTSGIPLAGSLSSLLSSDNQRLLILCDENQAEGGLQISGTSTIGAPSWLRWEVEHIAVRDDLLVFMEAKRASDGVFVEVGFGLSSLSDQSLTAESSNPAVYVGPQGQLVLRMVWIPSADLDSGDGWSVGVDFAEWRVRP